MKKKSKFLMPIITVAAMIMAIFTIVKATSTDKTELIYGTWRNTSGDNEYYEFSPNGAVILSNDKVNFSGKFTIDEEKIYVQLTNREAECKYYFEDGYLYIINESDEKSRLEKVEGDSEIIHKLENEEESSAEENIISDITENTEAD